MFRTIRAQRILLEFDDERSGSFEPLTEIPEDKTVVLGLITTKSPRMERTQDLAARIRQAARIVPLDRLALSPQCGFSSSIVGNQLTEEDEIQKLRLLTQTAEMVWKTR